MVRQLQRATFFRLENGKSFLFLAAIGLALAGCAKPRLDQFTAFAQAGTAYVQASDTLLRASQDAVIDCDTAVLINGRAEARMASPKLKKDSGLDVQQLTEVIDHNKRLQARVTVLQELSSHGKVLKAYFDTLAAMTDDKTGTALEAGVDANYKALTTLSESIRKKPLGDSLIDSLVPKVTDVVVQEFKVKALDSELKSRATLIAKEIAVQEGAMKALAQEFKNDLQASMNLDVTSAINHPYAALSEPLPDDWAAKRKDILIRTVSIQSADAAEKAAEKLRLAFQQLVEGRLPPPTLAQVITDCNSILDMAGTIKSSQSTAKK